MHASEHDSTTEDSMGAAKPRVAIIVGSTRPGRKAADVARWVHVVAQERDDAAFELVDIVDYALPLLDEPVPPMAAQYTQSHTLAWAATIASFDAFVFVSPEYNHASSAALKNAIDFLFAEWNDKAAALVTYGVDGGIRAAEHLRLVLGELRIASVRSTVSLSFGEDFEDYDAFTPRTTQRQSLTGTLDELVTWARAMRSIRVPAVVG